MARTPIFYRQQTHSDCGPTALQIVLSCFGVETTVGDMTNNMPCGSEGWTVDELCQAALQQGVYTTVIQCNVDPLSAISEHPLPIIVLANGHYFVVYKKGKQKIYLADPSYGKVVLETNDFVQQYGMCDALIITCSSVHVRDTASKSVTWGAVRCFNYLWSYFRPNSSDIAKLLLLIAVVGIVQSILPFISRAIVDDGLQTLSLSFIKLMAVASVVLMLSSILGIVCQAYIGAFMTYGVKCVMLGEYFDKMCRLSVERLRLYNIGDIMQRLHDSERIQTYLSNVFFASLSSLVFLVIYLAILFYFNTSLFGVAFAISLLFLGQKALFLKERRNIDVSIWGTQTKCNRHIIQSYDSAVDIKMNNLMGHFSVRWNQLVAMLHRQQLALFRFSQVQDALSNLIIQSKDILITYLSCSYVLDGNLTLGSLFAIQYLSGMLNGPLLKLVMFMDQSQIAQISLQRMSVFNNQPDEVEANKYGIGVFVPRHQHITFDQLSYRYPDGTVALRAFTMRFAHGQKIGIVGRSGCGKSTLLKLMCGLLSPTAGDIYIGSANTKSMNWDDLRRSEFSTVLQDNDLFDGTILTNIICSEPYNETRLVQCVEMAQMRDDIERMPLSYRTVVGHGGKNLSAGQKQRLLIARALYRDAKVLLFDEMANALPTLMEQRIVDKIDIHRANALRIYATHRAQAIKNADLILVMDNGRLVDMGRHDYLAAKPGYYKSLITES